MQLDLFDSSIPSFILDSIEWASVQNGELILLVNGAYGVGEWLRQNLEIKKIKMQTNHQIAVRAIAPKWAGELRAKKWDGGSGSSHPLNDLDW